MTSIIRRIVKLFFWILSWIARFVLWFLDNILRLRPEEDATLSTVEIIRKYGYEGESHQVTTEDGYILTLHRIPYGKGGRRNENAIRSKGSPPILIQHGIESSSGWWFLVPPHVALPFLLADEGFDVWLGNARGNEYSRSHNKLRTHQREFWKFSFDEMGHFDMPAAIDYILEVTGAEKLKAYIGHSMGTSMGFVCLSMRPEYNEKVEKMIALSPVAFIKNNKGLLNWLFSAIPDKIMIVAIDHFSAGGPDPLLKWLREVLCRLCLNRYGRKLARLWFSVASRKDNSRNASSAAMSKALAHMRSGSAFRVFIHFFQLIRTGQFTRLDMGEKHNLRRYGVNYPPAYDLHKVTCPVYALYSVGDSICSPHDVQRTLAALGNCVNKDSACIPCPDFQHADFCYSERAKELVYDRVIEYLSSNEESLI